MKSVLVQNCGSIADVQSLLKDRKLSPEFFLYEEFDVPLSVPSPKVVNFEFTPRPLNASFVPLASFACLHEKDYRNRLDQAGFSALEKNVSSIKFVMISYQKTEMSRD